MGLRLSLEVLTYWFGMGQQAFQGWEFLCVPCLEHWCLLSTFIFIRLSSPGSDVMFSQEASL